MVRRWLGNDEQKKTEFRRTDPRDRRSSTLLKSDSPAAPAASEVIQPLLATWSKASGARALRTPGREAEGERQER